MNMTDILRQTGALDAISRELGITPQDAQAGASALLPALLGGFQKRAEAQPPGGSAGDDLLGLLGGLGGGSLLNAITSEHPTPREPGNEILGQVFGSREVSRTVAGQAAQSTGIDPAILKQMLPLLAMAVSGYLASRGGAARQAGGSGTGGLDGQMLGGGGQRSGGLGGLLSALDVDRNGNPLDDIMRMVGRFRR